MIVHSSPWFIYVEIAFSKWDIATELYEIVYYIYLKITKISKLRFVIMMTEIKITAEDF